MFKVAIFALGLLAFSSALPRPQRFGMGRIIGGEEATPHEFPYVVSFQWLQNHMCMGTIISATAVLIPAQCAEIGNPIHWTVKAGKHSIKKIEATEQSREIVSVTVHPGFRDTTDYSNDIAVLRTSAPFVFNAAVTPIPIAPAGHTATGTGVIQGWGTTVEDEIQDPDILMKAELPIVSDETCRNAVGDSNVEDNMICAGFAAGGVGFCTLDFGAPLAATDLGYRYLAGIASWSYGCGRPGLYGGYTEISHHTEFIRSNAWN